MRSGGTGTDDDMMPNLFTTIPPRHVGVDLESRAHSSHQRSAIRSWHECGFNPVSIHLAEEIDHNPHLPEALAACGVETLVIGHANGAASGPLCPIVDFLSAIGNRVGDESFVIVNADIVLVNDGSRPLASLVSQLGEGEHLIAQRTDVAVDRNGRRRESVFAHGFDLVAMRGSWIQRVVPFLTPTLAFGRPWWDHYLPLALIALGSRTHLVDPARCLHESHPFRWNKRQYCSIGRQAMEHFHETVVRDAASAGARAWLTAIESGMTPIALPKATAKAVRRIALHSAAPDLLAASVLKRLARANVRLILQSAHDGGLRCDAGRRTPA